MDNRTAGFFGLAIVAVGAAMKWADFRAGRANFAPGRAGSSGQIDRMANPGRFWVLTLLNSALLGVILVASVIGIVAP